MFRYLGGVIFGLVLLAVSCQMGFADEQLDQLFDKLQVAEDTNEAKTIETQIWEIWNESAQDNINTLMGHGVMAMKFQQYHVALKIFSIVVDAEPDFAEGWNKRAIVHFLMSNYEASIQDIQRTLKLEPRHFGAISGLGLIRASQGNYPEALEAFEAVLKIHPYLEGVRENVDSLKHTILTQSI